ncbi:hypothetical protein ElyMa_001560000 [Elysia marginata]|uniref:Uncharacterized protein n=1 Tax=Elysia marginata TaxID=1093978 RepID=A0AAV4JB65_9GAST|nr:hypothetical protein ElyMa_001560000 [Elysia marginata]
MWAQREYTAEEWREGGVSMSKMIIVITDREHLSTDTLQSVQVLAVIDRDGGDYAGLNLSTTQSREEIKLPTTIRDSVSSLETLSVFEALGYIHKR